MNQTGNTPSLTTAIGATIGVCRACRGAGCSECKPSKKAKAIIASSKTKSEHKEKKKSNSTATSTATASRWSHGMPSILLDTIWSYVDYHVLLTRVERTCHSWRLLSRAQGIGWYHITINDLPSNGVRQGTAILSKIGVQQLGAIRSVSCTWDNLATALHTFQRLPSSRLCHVDTVIHHISYGVNDDQKGDDQLDHHDTTERLVQLYTLLPLWTRLRSFHLNLQLECFERRNDEADDDDDEDGQDRYIGWNQAVLIPSIPSLQHLQLKGDGRLTYDIAPLPSLCIFHCSNAFELHLTSGNGNACTRPSKLPNTSAEAKQLARHASSMMYEPSLRHVYDFSFILPGACDENYTSCALRTVLHSCQRSLRQLTISIHDDVQPWFKADDAVLSTNTKVRTIISGSGGDENKRGSSAVITVDQYRRQFAMVYPHLCHLQSCYIRTASYAETMTIVLPIWYQSRASLTCVAIPFIISKDDDGSDQYPVGRHSQDPISGRVGVPYSDQALSRVGHVINAIEDMPLVTRVIINDQWSSHMISAAYQLVLVQSLPQLVMINDTDRHQWLDATRRYHDNEIRRARIARMPPPPDHPVPPQ